jgi:hypothetical protein
MDVYRAARVLNLIRSDLLRSIRSQYGMHHARRLFLAVPGPQTTSVSPPRGNLKPGSNNEMECSTPFGITCRLLLLATYHSRKGWIVSWGWSARLTLLF